MKITDMIEDHACLNIITSILTGLYVQKDAEYQERFNQARPSLISIRDGLLERIKDNGG